MKMAVGVVDSLDDAIDHVNRARHRALGGDRHRAPTRPREAFTGGVDAAAVYVNASTRFTDGFEFGHGRRDRQLDPEAARPRADRPARADHDQVRGPRHGQVRE